MVMISDILTRSQINRNYRIFVRPLSGGKYFPRSAKFLHTAEIRAISLFHSGIDNSLGLPQDVHPLYFVFSMDLCKIS